MLQVPKMTFLKSRMLRTVAVTVTIDKDDNCVQKGS